MKIKTYILLALAIGAIGLGVFTASDTAQAATIFERMQDSISSFEDLPSGGEDAESVENNTLRVIGQLINAVLSFFGVIFLVLVVYGGYRWMMARGNEEEVKKGRDILRNAIVGLIIVTAAFAISVFVTASLQDALAPQQGQTGQPVGN